MSSSPQTTPDEFAHCPICPVPLQRTPDGTLADGFGLHVEWVHETVTEDEQARIDRHMSLLKRRL